MLILKTNLGDIHIELDHTNTPMTAKNITDYAKSGFYDGTIFHRVIDGFMVQGGGMTEDMEQKETNMPIDNEADKGGKNLRGTVAMARTSDPHSATAQFFINVADNAFLDFKDKTQSGWGYCVFAKVTEGMDIVDKIEKVATGNHGYHADVPLEAIKIKSVVVAEAS